MAYNADYVKEKLTKELEATHVEVVDNSDGCGSKFTVVVVSPKFTGKPLLQQQRMVNEVLKVEMETIHALSQRTLTPEQWEKQKSNNSATASAPGKVILFGEHSVVYGKNAVAATLSRRTKVTVTLQPETRSIVLAMPAVGINHVVITLPDVEPTHRSSSLEDSVLNMTEITANATAQLLSRLSWWADVVCQHGTTKGAEQALAVLAYLHSELCTDFCQGLTVTVDSQLKPGAGTGSSAAYSVAMAAALSQLAAAQFDQDKIELLAWKAEHFVHGKPSGLDTAISTRGGIVTFCRKDNMASFLPNPLPNWSLRILLVDSCVERNTRHMVERARARMDAVQDAVTENLLGAMNHVALTAVQALQEDQVVGFSRLENLVQVNQGLLSALGVSHPALDAICATAARHGLSAKLTGAGGGGNAFVLLPPDLSSSKLQELQQQLTAQGFTSSEETLFGPGVNLIEM